MLSVRSDNNKILEKWSFLTKKSLDLLRWERRKCVYSLDLPTLLDPLNIGLADTWKIPALNGFTFLQEKEKRKENNSHTAKHV